MPVLQTHSGVYFDWSFWLLVCHNDCTLFSTNDELGSCLWTVFEGCRSYCDFFSVWIKILNFQRFCSLFLEFSGIPKVGESISRDRDTFVTSFCHEPLEMSNWITVWSFDMSQGDRVGAGSWIPHSYNTIGTTCADNVSKFVVIG